MHAPKSPPAEGPVHTPRKRRKRHHSTTPKRAPVKPAGWLAYAVIIFITLACYLPIFQSGLIWSDYDQAERSAYQSMEGLADAWTLESIRREDPLTLSSYFLERLVPLPTGQVHHGINLLLHIAAACLFLKVLEALKLPAAFSASLVFALHPSVMQTVFWSGYREELVGLILILAALYFGIRNRSARDYAALCLLSALACLIHPAALVLPLLLTLCVVQQNRFPRLRDFNHLLPIFCLTLFIGVWTLSGFDASDGGSGERITQTSRNFFFNLERTFLPTDFGLFHPPSVTADFTAGAQYAFLPLFLLLPLYILILFNYKHFWARSLFFGLTFYLILSLHGLLGSGVFIDGREAQEDHLHYIALPFILAVFISTCGGSARSLGAAGKVLWYFGFTILILVQSGRVLAQSLNLRDPASMWLQMTEQWPDAWVPKFALIETMEAQDQPSDLLSQIEKIKIMENILTEQSELRSIRIALGRAYREDGQDSQALRHYRWITRQESPPEALMVEAADYYEALGLTWDATNTRERLKDLKETKTNQ